MEMYRLHIDVPLFSDEQSSIEETKRIAEILKTILSDKVKKVQYRLAFDDDRSVKNYMIKDENNHVANKKSVIE
jgi:hypothetical protein